MATQFAFGKIVTGGLILALDAADKNSYSGSGTTWNDVSRNGNNGTLTNGPTFSSTNGGFISFDGTDDYVTCGNSNVLNLTRTISMELWFNVNGLPPSWTNIYGKMDADGNTPTRVYTAFINASGYIHLCSADVSGQETLDSTAFITTGNWYHWVGTINRNAGTMIQYVNGILNVTGAVRATDAVINTDPLRVGYQGTLYSKYNGKVALARLYNRVLSPLEVLQNYNAQKSRFNL